MLKDIIKDFLVLWAVVDPIGNVPIFLSVTHGYGPRERRGIAVRAVFYSACILLFFIVAGQVLLEGLSIPLQSFQVAGGVILFIFALSMIFTEQKPPGDQKAGETHDPAVFPMAVPSIAGPGTMMAVVVLTDNSRFAIGEQALTAVVLLAVLAVVLVLLLASNAIQRVIGRSGSRVVSKVMGLLLASMAMEIILSGIRTYFAIGT